MNQELAGDREAARQRDLVRVLHERPLEGVPKIPGLVPLAGRKRNGRAVAQGPELPAGLAAYRANARASALRALAAAYPTVQQLLGDESFAVLATALRRAQPPLKGDLGWFGAGLADWLEQAAAPDEIAYLPDVARLEWAVHRACFAADQDALPVDLAPLAEVAPALLQVRFTPGTALLATDHPVVAIWQAHRSEDSGGGDTEEARAQSFALARAALAAGRRDHVLVWRRGWRVEVGLLDAAGAAFTSSLMAGASLGRALEDAVRGDEAGRGDGDGDFSFETWLLRALREGWLAAFELQGGESDDPPRVRPATRSAAS